MAGGRQARTAGSCGFAARVGVSLLAHAEPAASPARHACRKTPVSRDLASSQRTRESSETGDAMEFDGVRPETIVTLAES